MGTTKQRPAWLQQLWRLLLLGVLCVVSLQVFWLLRIGLMLVLDPQSTSFQRSEAWRLLVQTQQVAWSQQWVDMPRIGTALQRAVIASEDATFVEHSGVEWDAIEKAWERNRAAEARAEARTAARPNRPVQAKLVGGSTISQQLAKNLFLSGERTPLRKAQELLITVTLEAILPKERILEIYLNNVEWGEGVFGAQAAARHYFRSDANKLAPWQAARLAVMLPAPKRFEKKSRLSLFAGPRRHGDGADGGCGVAMSVSAEIAAAAAALVVEEGMEYASAKRKAARAFGSRPKLPGDEELEDAVREHIALFCAETQPAELRALREVAALWMQRLAAFRPHVGGAVWRGTATALSSVRLDLYCDDPKSAQILLLNEGVDFDSGELPGHGREPLSVLTVASRNAALREPVTVHLVLHDADDQRGALLPDARGRAWRGDLAALQRMMAGDH